MAKINCNVARDIMMLCMDGLASADTKKLLDTHMEECTECRAEYQRLGEEMKLPVDDNLQKESRRVFNEFRFRLRRQKMIALCIGLLLAFAAVAGCMMAYQHVGVIHDFFSPHEVAIVRNASYANGWQELDIGGGILEFDGLFWKREVTSHADSGGPVELRFTDENGRVCLDGIVVAPGCSVQLDKLARNQKYIVEYCADCDFLYLDFH